MARVESNITIENARLLFKNFRGEAGKFNQEGERSFNVILPPELAAAMKEDGWAVKTPEPREEGDQPDSRVAVSLGKPGKGRPPTLVLITSKGRTQLDIEDAGILDYVDIKNVDLIIRPYNWKLDSGAQGVKAYLKSLYLTVEEDYLELKYNDVPEALGQPAQPLAIEANDGIIDAEVVSDTDDGPPW